MVDHRHLTIAILAENASTRPGILGEWGLSMLVSTEDRRFLLDTGASHSTVSNADAVGIDLEGIDAIVLSHGHSDHTGGLAAVLARTGSVRVIAHPAALEPKYGAGDEPGRFRYGGIPHRREALESAGARFELAASPTWLTEHIAASGEEPLSTDFQAVSTRHFIKRSDQFVPDPMDDDQSLYIRTDLGLVILLGCAHRGCINIIRHAQALMRTQEVYLVAGGTHLGPASSEQTGRTIAALKEMGVRWLALSHCTGLTVASRLSAEFGGRFFFSNAGTTIAFPIDR